MATLGQPVSIIYVRFGKNIGNNTIINKNMRIKNYIYFK